MTEEFYSYITRDGDRWDMISQKYYSNPNLYEEIIKANPEVPIEPVLEAGIKLKIPVLEESETIQFELPPWKK
jgi:phage tail protein X|nr:MAG TPA: tail protein [Caudoviricetes sp.]